MAESTINTGQGAGPEDGAEGIMTLREHLVELRKRMTIAAIAVVLASFSLWPFKDAVFRLMASPLPEGVGLQQIAPTEAFFTFIKLSMIAGVGFASPLVMYEILAFVAPGLYANEKRWLYISIPAIAVMFTIGALFAWFVVLRFTMMFLTQFTPDFIRTELTLDNHVTFVAKLIVAVGLVFETPFVIFLLAKLRIVDARKLSHFRRYAIVVIVIVAAIITPTPDPFTQMTVAIPMYLLYEIGILMARIAVPAVDAEQVTEQTAE